MEIGLPSGISSPFPSQTSFRLSLFPRSHRFPCPPLRTFNCFVEFFFPPLVRWLPPPGKPLSPSFIDTSTAFRTALAVSPSSLTKFPSLLGLCSPSFRSLWRTFHNFSSFSASPLLRDLFSLFCFPSLALWLLFRFWVRTPSCVTKAVASPPLRVPAYLFPCLFSPFLSFSLWVCCLMSKVGSLLSSLPVSSLPF